MSEPSGKLTLTLGHLYPDQLNMYGDRGNILTLRRRCEWRGVDLRVVPLDLGEPVDHTAYDMLFIGGGQDKEQDEVALDLRAVKADGVRAAVEEDMPVLAVCGGYQLLAKYYRPAEGPDLVGLGIFDAWTIHKGAHIPRCIGDIAIEWNGSTLVGFENHGGRTYLGTAKPLGRVLRGHGNNSEDHTEGAVYRNAFGTYLHGSLLPKNPHFADHLLALALRRSYGLSDDDLKRIFPRYLSLAEQPVKGTRAKKRAASRKDASDAINGTLLASTDLDDALEWEAHASMLERLGLRQAAGAALRHR